MATVSVLIVNLICFLFDEILLFKAGKMNTVVQKLYLLYTVKKE